MATFVWPPISVTASSGPVQYNLNGAATTVSQDTVTPANSRPLPVVNLNSSGSAVDPATSQKQDTGNTSLATIATNTTGVATAAKQDTGNTSLSSIDTKTPALQSGNVPVQLPASQITALTPPTTVTANQGTGGASAWKVDGSAVTQPVSAASLPLPTGASTESTLSAMSAKLPASIGSKAGASSLSIVPATDATFNSVNTDLTASASITTQNLNPNSGTATAGSTVAVTLSGQNTVSIQVTGTYTGALTPQVTVDGSNWIAINGLINVNTGAQTTTIVSATVGIFQIEASGMAQFRLTALAAVTGTAVVTLRASVAQSAVSVDNTIPAVTTVSTVSAVTSITNALPTGTNTIGTVLQLGGASGNSPGSGSATTTATTLTAPGNSQGFILQNQDSANNLRYRIGATATTTSGQRLLPAQDSGYVPGGASISIIAESGTCAYDVQWIVR